MFLSPVIERELRTALRKHKAVKSRFRTALAGAGFVTLFMLIGLVDRSPSWGRTLHEYIFLGGLYMAVVPPARISVGLFSEELRNQTLELLYLAGLGPGELFIGKLLGGVLVASSDLLAIFPFLAVPFLNGGISLDLFVATITCFPLLFLFIVSVCVLASVLCRDDGVALVCAAAIVAVLSLAIPIPYSLGRTLTGAPPFSAGWLCLSPAYGPYLVWQKFFGARPGDFWASAGATVAWTILCFGLAAFFLKRNWRRELEKNTIVGWRGTWLSLIHGSEAWRLALRRRVMGTNPFQWLAEQDRRPTLLAWAIVGGTSLVWLLGWGTWPQAWPSTGNFFATAILLIAGTGLVETYTAARRIGNDRRDGALELLLTTSLMPEEMLDGQAAALKSQFRPVRMAVFGLCVLMMLGGYLTRTWNTETLISYVLIWCLLLVWCAWRSRRKTPRAMWIALNSGRPTLAILGRQQSGWWWIWMIFNLRNFSRGFSRSSVNFPTGSVEEIVIVSVIVIVVALVLLAQWAGSDPVRGRLIDEMRSIAREPVPERNDPRFKKWDVTKRLPPRSGYEAMSDYVRKFPERSAGGSPRAS